VVIHENAHLMKLSETAVYKSNLNKADLK
jgi:hypothetical protein